MTMLNHEPVIRHLHPSERPGDPEARHDLIRRALKCIGNPEDNSQDYRLLCYLSDIDDGFFKNSVMEAQQAGSHLERVRPRLVRCGYIAHLPWHSISIDWHHIRVYATYINPRKTGFYEDGEYEPVTPERQPSIMAKLKCTDKFILAETGAFGAIQDMSESELVDLLDHFACLVSVPQGLDS